MKEEDENIKVKIQIITLSNSMYLLQFLHCLQEYVDCNQILIYLKFGLRTFCVRVSNVFAIEFNF